jgi:hypothetical protein
LHSNVFELFPTSTKLLQSSAEKEKQFSEKLKVFNVISEKLSKGVKYEELSEQEKLLVWQ